MSSARIQRGCRSTERPLIQPLDNILQKWVSTWQPSQRCLLASALSLTQLQKAVSHKITSTTKVLCRSSRRQQPTSAAKRTFLSPLMSNSLSTRNSKAVRRRYMKIKTWTRPSQICKGMILMTKKSFRPSRCPRWSSRPRVKACSTSAALLTLRKRSLYRQTRTYACSLHRLMARLCCCPGTNTKISTLSRPPV